MFTAVIRGREAVNEMGRCRHCCSARQMPVTQILQYGKSKGKIWWELLWLCVVLLLFNDRGEVLNWVGSQTLLLLSVLGSYWYFGALAPFFLRTGTAWQRAPSARASQLQVCGAGEGWGASQPYSWCPLCSSSLHGYFIQSIFWMRNTKFTNLWNPFVVGTKKAL